MRYVSTRGQAEPRDFAGVLRAGLAEDGGLYVPETWPALPAADWRALRALPYPDLAARLIALFADGSIPDAAIQDACAEAARGFAHPAIVPLVQLGPALFVQELFHGPTLAFKDLALRTVAGLLGPEPVTLIGATSGDTGSAAIAAFAGRPGARIVILHPKGRTSDIQRRQMTTVIAPNVLNLAVEGSFDDCQDIVKSLFADPAFRAETRLTAVNSINWGRIAAQVAHFAFAALALGAPDREIAFAVPTGNFGHVLAAWIARRLGLPIARLVVASNRNDILARFLAANDMSVRTVEPSLSPSMDIQVSSNFERLLFELLDRDPGRLAAAMRDFRSTGAMPVPPDAWERARALFVGHRANDDDTAATMRRVYAETGYLADPHTAVALAAVDAVPLDMPVVVTATAHPAKFPEAVAAATGIAPSLPARLARLADLPERFQVVPAAVDAVRDAMASNWPVSRRGHPTSA